MGRSNCRARSRSRSLTDGTAGTSAGAARDLGVSMASVLSPGTGEGACVPSGISGGGVVVQVPGETSGSGRPVVPSSAPSGEGGAANTGVGAAARADAGKVDAPAAGGTARGTRPRVVTIQAPAAPSTSPARKAPVVLNRGSLLEDRRGSGPYHVGELEGVPVRHADAAVRLRLADGGGFGRAVDSVMLLRQVDPHDPDRTIRTRCDLGLRVLALRVPEQVRVVEERGVARHAGDLPGAEGQGIVLGAHRGRIAPAHATRSVVAG